MKRFLSGLAAALLTTAPVAASELVSTANETTASAIRPAAVATLPPLGVTESPAGWDGPTPEPSPGGCHNPPDAKMHGQVWAGVGTRGYRDVGAAVTAPLGKCGAVSIAVGQSEGGYTDRPR